MHLASATANEVLVSFACVSLFLTLLVTVTMITFRRDRQVHDTQIMPLTLYGPLYGNTVIGTLVDGWAVTFGTARRGLGGLRSRPVPSSLYQM